MSGDYSRYTLRPNRNYSGVLHQQGRPLLDSDQIEGVEIVDRRIRAVTVDVGGEAFVPRETPDGFKIARSGSDYTIGAGRAYVHGLLAECWGTGAVNTATGPISNLPFVLVTAQMQIASAQRLRTPGGDSSGSLASIAASGAGGAVSTNGGGPAAAPVASATAFDPVMGDLVGTGPLLWAQQPFYYSPQFPTVPQTGNGLVYLDVWTDDVTATEDPLLKDIALGGVDTTTRRQIRWQVKAIATSGAPTCSAGSPEWAALIAPSTGRLTTAAPLGTPTGKPCVIDPVAGYRELENRLYRVQIQTSGPLSGPNAATFVVSSDHASDSARVLGVTNGTGTSCTLQLSRIGRDEVLRFQAGDVIEFLDDMTEFSIRETNTGGTFATVSNPDQDNATIDLDVDLTNAVFPAHNARIRRWDEKPKPVQTTAIQLKHGTDPTGIEITFGPDPSAVLRAGDWWAFAARTADGSIEELRNAPPRGILHHYAKLAVTKAGAIVHDCRTLWPPLGCCTIVLSPGDDVQAGINALPAGGGCVCLRNGVYELDATLTLDGKANVVMHAESPRGAELRAPANTTTVLMVGSTTGGVAHVRLADLRFTSQGPAAPPAPKLGIVEFHGSGSAEIVNCELAHVTAGTSLPAAGILCDNVGAATIADCAISNALSGIAIRSGRDVAISDCALNGPLAAAASAGVEGIACNGVAGIVRVERCDVADFETGIIVDATPAGVLIAENSVRRGRSAVPVGNVVSPARYPNLSFGPTGAFGVLLGGYRYGIIVRAAGAEVARNTLLLGDTDQGGIIALGSRAVVEGNRIDATLVTPQATGPYPAGIVAYAPAGTLEAVTIRANVCTGAQHPILVLGESSGMVRSVAIENNVLTTGVVQPGGDPTLTVLSIWSPVLDTLAVAAAIVCINADGVTIEENLVTASSVAIAVSDGYTMRCRSNRIRGSTVALLARFVPELLLEGNFVNDGACGFLVMTCDKVMMIGNMLENTILGVVTWAVGDVAILAHDHTGGSDGIDVTGAPLTAGARAWGLAVAGARFRGLAGAAIAVSGFDGEVTITDCTVRECATASGTARVQQRIFQGNAYPGSVAVVLSGVREASLRGCTFIDNGPPTQGPPPPGIVADVHAHVSDALLVAGCRFRRTAPQGSGSAAVIAGVVADPVMTGTSDPRVQFVDNDVDVNDPVPVVMLQTWVVRTPQNVVVQGSQTARVRGAAAGITGIAPPEILSTPQGSPGGTAGSIVGPFVGVPAVVFVPPAVDPITDGADVVFANNVIVAHGPASTQSPVVAIQAWTLALTGNRVRSTFATVPFLLVVGTWAATGNVTRGQPAPSPAPVPAPYQTYNVVV
jgi:nitrous oxidase accessory protein NosD